MATRFRKAVVALARAKNRPTAENIEKAIYWCWQEYAYGGSMASREMFDEARAIVTPSKES
jgi:hypothetical protein